MRRLLISLSACLVPALAAAQDKVDCTNPTAQIELNYCAQQAYLAADKDLNSAYKKAMAAMKELDSELEPAQRGAADALKEAQRDWIAYRDKACNAEGYLVMGGSMLGELVNECLERLTQQRTGDLDVIIKWMAN